MCDQRQIRRPHNPKGPRRHPLRMPWNTGKTQNIIQRPDLIIRLHHPPQVSLHGMGGLLIRFTIQHTTDEHNGGITHTAPRDTVGEDFAGDGGGGLGAGGGFVEEEVPGREEDAVEEGAGETWTNMCVCVREWVGIGGGEGVKLDQTKQNGYSLFFPPSISLPVEELPFVYTHTHTSINNPPRLQVPPGDPCLLPSPRSSFPSSMSMCPPTTRGFNKLTDHITEGHHKGA